MAKGEYHSDVREAQAAIGSTRSSEAAFDYVGTPSPWLDPEWRRVVEGFRFYQRIRPMQ